MSDLVDLTIAEAAPLIRQQRISPVELADAYLQRIAAVNDACNAFITVTRDRAIGDAARAETEIRSGRYRGPLHGVPVALKDIIATAGIRTTCGSRILGEWIPESDAHVARLLAGAGTVLLGKLNTHEFALGATNNNPHYGAVRNPWDLRKVSGGSSGGASVAATARLVMAAIGTDTGGSIRIPASFSGCVGLKPTYGRVSRTGIFPVSSLRDHVGPLTRTVEDAALVLQTITGYDPADANSADVPSGDYLGVLKDGIAGMRIGLPEGRFKDLSTSDVRRAIADAVGVLAELGAEIVPIELDLTNDDAATASVLSAVETRHYHRNHLRDHRSDYGLDLQERLNGPEPDRRSISEALEASEAIRVAFQRVLATVDLIVTPTLPVTAPAIGADRIEVEGREYSEEDLAAFTAPMNHARVPALSVPCGFCSANMPIGMTFTGKQFAEAAVLRAGYAYEQASEWHRLVPPAVELADPGR